MTGISISERRAIMADCLSTPDFCDLLQRDPAAAIRRATGHDVPGGVRITVFEERPDAWEFVVPADDIEAELPQAVDARGVVENDVYALLRDEPGVRSRVVSDPKGFLLERFQLDIGPAAVNVREEQPGELMLVLPYADSRDELNDAALDLVAGGGVTGTEGGVAMEEDETGRKGNGGGG